MKAKNNRVERGRGAVKAAICSSGRHSKEKERERVDEELCWQGGIHKKYIGERKRKRRKVKRSTDRFAASHVDRGKKKKLNLQLVSSQHEKYISEYELNFSPVHSHTVFSLSLPLTLTKCRVN